MWSKYNVEHLTLLTGIAYQSIIYYAEAAHDRCTQKQRNTHKKDSKNENYCISYG